jgi:hypothetical protein
MNLLEELVRRGFTFHVFEAYPKQLGAVKSGFIVLLDLSAEGRWTRFSAPGYLIDGQIGLLIERSGRQVFVHKSAEVAAGSELLAGYREFCIEIESVLILQGNAS